MLSMWDDKKECLEMPPQGGGTRDGTSEGILDRQIVVSQLFLMGRQSPKSSTIASRTVGTNW